LPLFITNASGEQVASTHTMPAPQIDESVEGVSPLTTASGEVKCYDNPLGTTCECNLMHDRRIFKESVTCSSDGAVPVECLTPPKRIGTTFQSIEGQWGVHQATACENIMKTLLVDLGESFDDWDFKRTMSWPTTRRR